MYNIHATNTAKGHWALHPQKLFLRKLWEGHSTRIVLLENLAPYGMCLKNCINLLRGQILINRINFSHVYNCTFTVTSTQRKPSRYSVSVTRGQGRLVRWRRTRGIENMADINRTFTQASGSSGLRHNSVLSWKWRRVSAISQRHSGYFKA